MNSLRVRPILCRNKRLSLSLIGLLIGIRRGAVIRKRYVKMHKNMLTKLIRKGIPVKEDSTPQTKKESRPFKSLLLLKQLIRLLFKAEKAQV